MDQAAPIPGEVAKDDRVELAAAEGHDADIPVSEGFVKEIVARHKDQVSTHSRRDVTNGWTENDREQTSGVEDRLSAAQITPTGDAELDVEKQEDTVSSRTTIQEETSGVPDSQDPNIVDWDGPDDPLNPMNWAASRRWGMIAVVSAITFLTPLGSSMFAPGVPLVMQDFNSTNEPLASFVVSVYVLGFAFGPLGMLSY